MIVVNESYESLNIDDISDQYVRFCFSLVDDATKIGSLMSISRWKRSIKLSSLDVFLEWFASKSLANLLFASEHSSLVHPIGTGQASMRSLPWNRILCRLGGIGYHGAPNSGSKYMSIVSLQNCSKASVFIFKPEKWN